MEIVREYSSELVTIIGFLVSSILLSRQISSGFSLSLYKDKKELYYEVYKIVINAVQQTSIVFDYNYEKQVEELWIKISLLADKKVSENFSDYYYYIKNIRDRYSDYRKENMHTEYFYDETSEEYNEIYNPMEEERYKKLIKQYEKDNAPQESELIKRSESILKAMKKDLKTDK